jgi:hypothetical protein
MIMKVFPARLFYVATFVTGMLGGAAVGLVWTI